MAWRDPASPGALPARQAPSDAAPSALIDSFGRRVDYVRLSVTDRCDLRCRYCMPDQMSFAPRRELLSFAEIETLVDALIARGVRRLRLTGGEPLVRRGVADLLDALGTRIGNGLDEITLTTNGTQLAGLAERIRASGVRRINVSLDTLDAARYAELTRRGQLERVLEGLAAARAAGLSIKINMVALAGVNEDEIAGMLRWCLERDFDLTLIETMPLGDVGEARIEHYLPLDAVRDRLAAQFSLAPSSHRTGGPARYFAVEGGATRLGFITPLTQNFCAGCNRIRISATGSVYGCLGRDQRVDLREPLRSGDQAALDRRLDGLIAGKPQGHDFRIEAGDPAVARHMNVTGG